MEDFGLASGPTDDGQYDRLWHAEPIEPEEVAFEPNVFLLTKAKAEGLKQTSEGPPHPPPGPGPQPEPEPTPEPEPVPGPEPSPRPEKTTLRLSGTFPPEVWNRLGTRLIPKLRAGEDFSSRIELSVRVDSRTVDTTVTELRQILKELGVDGGFDIETTQANKPVRAPTHIAQTGRNIIPRIKCRPSHKMLCTFNEQNSFHRSYPHPGFPVVGGYRA